jgi:hypothetical protein
MSKIDRGRKITLSFKEKGASGKATLLIDVSSDESDLPHEHRDDMKEIAAELLGVPLETLKDVEIELKKKHGDHSHIPQKPAALPTDTKDPEKKEA